MNKRFVAPKLKNLVRMGWAFALVALVLVSCKDDEDQNPEPEILLAGKGDIVINEIQLSGTKAVELFNASNTTLNISDYWLCLGPGQYSQLSSLTVLNGSTELAAGGFLTIQYDDLGETSGGLGLYTSNAFTDPDYIISFVQYGEAGAARENIAAAANIWTSGEYVPLPLTAGNTLSYNGQGNSASDWLETEPTLGAANGDMVEAPRAEKGEIVINEIQLDGTKAVELFNASGSTFDLSDYWLCLGPGQYSQLNSLTVMNGSTQLAAGEYLTVQYDDLGTEAGGLGLYTSNAFTSADAIISFVQYGNAGAARENVAADAGIWTTGEYVPLPATASNTLSYDGEGNSATDWIETEPSLGEANGEAVPVADAVFINEVIFAEGGYVEFYNSGSATVNVSDYWLCLGPGQYEQLNSLNVVSGSLEIAAGELLVVQSGIISNTAGGLGLYRNNSFTSAEAIVDFVQYGSAGAARENVAVAAGIWEAGTYVPLTVPGNSIEFDGEGNAVNDWTEAIPSFGQANKNQVLKTGIVISEVEFTSLKQVELRNNYANAKDVSDYWLCLGPGEYRRLGDLTVVSGDLNIPAGGLLVVNYDLLGDNDEGLGLYESNAFTSTDAIVDFVQYGSAGSARENVAVAAGVWTAGQYIDVSGIANGNSIGYDGGGITAADWYVRTEPSLGSVK